MWKVERSTVEKTDAARCAFLAKKHESAGEQGIGVRRESEISREMDDDEGDSEIGRQQAPVRCGHSCVQAAAAAMPRGEKKNIRPPPLPFFLPSFLASGRRRSAISAFALSMRRRTQEPAQVLERGGGQMSDECGVAFVDRFGNSQARCNRSAGAMGQLRGWRGGDQVAVAMGQLRGWRGGASATADIKTAMGQLRGWRGNNGAKVAMGQLRGWRGGGFDERRIRSCVCRQIRQ